MDIRASITDPEEIAMFLPKKGVEVPPGCDKLIAGAQKYGTLMRYCLLSPAIKLDQGYRAVVDPDDYVRLNRVGWRIKKSRSGIYAVKYYRRKGKSGCVYLHRDILNAQAGFDIHHRNGYTLDERKQNLQTMRSTDHQSHEAERRIQKRIGGNTRIKNQQI